MQLKATGVRWQKLQKDTERNEGGGVHVRMCESCWRMLMRFLHKAKIHESLISQKLVHYLTPFPRDSRWASSYPGLLYPRHDLSTCHISYMRKIKKQGSEFTPQIRDHGKINPHCDHVSICRTDLSSRLYQRRDCLSYSLAKMLENTMWSRCLDHIWRWLGR